MASQTELAVHGFQRSIQRKKSTGGKRKGRGSHPNWIARAGSSDDGSVLGGNGGRRRHWNEARLRLARAKKLTVDGIGRRRRRLFMRRGPLGGTSSRGAGAGTNSMVSGRRRTPWMASGSITSGRWKRIPLTRGPGLAAIRREGGRGGFGCGRLGRPVAAHGR
jgi:hypothetical protein